MKISDLKTSNLITPLKSIYILKLPNTLLHEIQKIELTIISYFNFLVQDEFCMHLQLK